MTAEDPGPGLRERRVYVVEDADDLRMLYRLSLERAGFVVVGEAATGAEAIAGAAATQPHIVLVDLMLPDASGLDVVADLSGQLPEAVVIVCSGLDDPGTEGACLDAGAAGFLDKAEASNIADALRRLLPG